MALPSPGSLSLEPLEGPDPEPNSASGLDSLEEEQWGPTCDILLDLEGEQSMDVILVGSSELSCPPSLQPSRDLIAYEVRVKQRHIEDICICCGSFQVWTEHPLFEGGMCAPCKGKFLDSVFLYDDDGYQSYCSICCSGETLLICENPDCTRNGLLQRRKKWRARLKAFQDQEAESPFEIYKTVPAWKREPVRVLSLFGDIREELASLGFLEGGSDHGQLKHLDDVTNIVRRDVEEWGPFDLVYGSTPPLATPWSDLLFHRVLQYARPRPGSKRPFFWMFVDNLVLTVEDRLVASRFLETDPVTIQDVCGRVPGTPCTFGATFQP